MSPIERIFLVLSDQLPADILSEEDVKLMEELAFDAVANKIATHQIEDITQ
jgi:hypothetical protein